MGPQAGIGWCFRLELRLTEIFRPCDFEFFNRIGQELSFTTDCFNSVSVKLSLGLLRN